MVRPSDPHAADAGSIPLVQLGTFLPESTFSADSYSVRTPLCAVTCIYICAHIKDRLFFSSTAISVEQNFGLKPWVMTQWGAADAEIKVPSGENTELKRSPFQAWSRSVYSHTCYAYCQGVLPCLFLPFQSIHLHFFQNLSQYFPVLACRIK